MNHTYYLVDNNALLKIGRRRLTTDFFQKRCRLTEDVAFEAGDRSRALALVPVTPRTLELLREIMSSVAPGDTDLIDLYHNKGAADPVMIASAMSLAEADSETLFPDTWVIVTLDEALITTAAQYHLDVLTPDDLARRIDEDTAAAS